MFLVEYDDIWLWEFLGISISISLYFIKKYITKAPILQLDFGVD